MDVLNTFVGAIPLDTDVPMQGRFAVEGLGFLSQLVMGAGAAATGLACTPGGSGLSVTIGAGALVQMQTLAPVASGSMPADGTPCVQQGINTGTTTLTIPGSGATYTVCGQVVVALGAPQVEAFYNANNPSQPYSGPANNGQASYTQTQARVSLSVTSGTAPSGSVALYTVTVPNGATSITQAMIVQAANGPFYPTLPQLVSGRLLAIQTITATQVYTPSTSAVRTIVVEGIGGGGSGAGAAATGAGQVSAGSGGGGGGFFRKRFASGFAGATANVGTGGASASVGAAGNNGQNTSFLTCSATGGQGGSFNAPSASSASYPTGGASGGVGSGGDVNAAGGAGNYAFYGTTASSGKGGGSYFGDGAQAITGSGNGAAAFTPGSGGSGGAQSVASSSGATGGAGANGLITIYEYS